MLYLHEPFADNDHYAIASRLSHFLTNTRPDPQLMDLARIVTLMLDAFATPVFQLHENQ